MTFHWQAPRNVSESSYSADLSKRFGFETKSGCIFQALTTATLEQAIDVVCKTFPPPQIEVPSAGFRASLVPSRDPKRLRYWVAIDANSGAVIGTTGLYKTSRDYDDAYWIGWMCVTPERRGEGVGKDLVEFTLAMAQCDGKRWLRLYTSTDPIETVAQILYEKYGFREKYRVPSRHSRYPLVVREKDILLNAPGVTDLETTRPAG